MPIKTIEKVEIMKKEDGSPKTKNIPNVGDLYELWVKCTDDFEGISMAKSTEPFYTTPGTKVSITEKTDRNGNPRLANNGNPEISVNRLKDDGSEWDNKPRYAMSQDNTPQGQVTSFANLSNIKGQYTKNTRGIEIGQALNKAADFMTNGTDCDKQTLFALATAILEVGDALRSGKELEFKKEPTPVAFEENPF
jgi:hypothetical protein